MLPKAVIFDLDGTLLNTLEDLADATNRVLTKHGFPTHPLEAYKYLIGEGATMLVTKALPPEHRDQATLEECLAEWHADYGKNWAVKTRPYPGIPELLGELKDRGIPSAILSNKPDEFTRLAAEALLPGWNFQAVIGQSPEMPRKPDPAGALFIAGGFGLSPQEIWFLGDSKVDMQTARAAGMIPVGVLWGFRSRDELLENGALALIEHPLKLFDVIINLQS